MTIFNKNMLAGAIEIARAEKDDPGLGCILLEPSGEVAACNRWAIYVAQPTNQKIVKSLPFSSDKPLENSCAISIAQMINLCKAIPVDRQFKGMLEHVSIVTEGQSVHCEFNDGRSVVKQKLCCSRIVPGLLNWKTRLKEIVDSVGLEGNHNFVFNRSRLLSVINAIEASCKYSGEFAFISQVKFATGYIWKSLNELTGQTIICAHVLPSASGSPEKSEWEKGLFEMKSKIMITVKKKKQTGDLDIARWVDKQCICGCRLRTDGKVQWCSSPKCNYIGTFINVLKRSR
jgi:hypothetical protein